MTRQRTELDCFRDDCDGTLYEHGYEKVCDQCHTVAEKTTTYSYHNVGDSIEDFWSHRKKYIDGELDGRPYVHGSWTRR